MSQLSEALGADVTVEWALACMRPQVHLQVGELTKGLEASIALVVHLSVLFTQRVRQRPVTARILSAAGPIAADCAGGTRAQP